MSHNDLTVRAEPSQASSEQLSPVYEDSAVDHFSSGAAFEAQHAQCGAATIYPCCELQVHMSKAERTLTLLERQIHFADAYSTLVGIQGREDLNHVDRLPSGIDSYYQLQQPTGQDAPLHYSSTSSFVSANGTSTPREEPAYSMPPELAASQSMPHRNVTRQRSARSGGLSMLRVSVGCVCPCRELFCIIAVRRELQLQRQLPCPVSLRVTAVSR